MFGVRYYFNIGRKFDNPADGRQGMCGTDLRRCQLWAGDFPNRNQVEDMHTLGGLKTKPQHDTCQILYIIHTTRNSLLVNGYSAQFQRTVLPCCQTAASRNTSITRR